MAEPNEGDVIAVWFSSGAASAVAAKLTVERYGKLCTVRLVNNPMLEEDIDNLRFLRDVETWLGVEVEFARHRDYPKRPRYIPIRMAMLWNANSASVARLSATNASEAITAWNRRSGTSQASEGEDEPYMWVREYPGHFGPDGGEPPSTDFSDVEKPGYFPLYRASPSKRVERLETALQRADQLFREALPKFNWGASALDANALRLLNEVPMEVTQALGGRS